MPFTLSHPAAAWLVRRQAPVLPLDAVVLGTMAPDFEYILRLRVYGRFGHTPLGLVAFCLPVGLLACWLFRATVRPALVQHLPPGMRVPAPPNRWTWTAAAVLAGSATHVLWDGFTHRSADFVVAFPALAAPLFGTIPAYTVLQHLSTASGAAVIALCVTAWVRGHSARTRRFGPGQRAAAIRAAAIILGGGMFAAGLNGARGAASGPARMLGYAAVGGMAGLAAAAVGYGLAARIRGSRGQ